METSRVSKAKEMRFGKEITECLKEVKPKKEKKVSVPKENVNVVEKLVELIDENINSAEFGGCSYEFKKGNLEIRMSTYDDGEDFHYLCIHKLEKRIIGTKMEKLFEIDADTMKLYYYESFRRLNSILVGAKRQKIQNNIENMFRNTEKELSQ